MKTTIMYVLLLGTMLFTLGCAEEEATPAPEKSEETEEVPADEKTTKEELKTQEETVDTFDNVNPDEMNASLGLTEDNDSSEFSPSSVPNTTAEEGDVSSVDTNGNGQVPIQEAKDAGFSMPITSDHWLYEYMQDRDGDGTVGE